MFRKLLIAFLALTMGMNLAMKASEGMWIPLLLKSLNESDMKAMGLKLSAEDIYSINKSSLKDAVVHFGGGCTAEIISNQGLLLTNHHCGFSQIQSHSSVENDYLKDGFWAMSKSAELPNPGLTATFIVRIEDVTAKILKGTEGKDIAARAGIVATNMAKIEAEVEKAEPLHQAKVKAFFYGNEFYMIITKTYRDVRLVGAPPSSVGKYGGDTDNWMWPRHTGDFSVFRIYSGKDGEPADHAESNIPLKPGHSFPVSVKGTEPGDFTMVYGFPGTTQQYLHSAAVEFITGEMNPQAISMRAKSLEVIVEAMGRSDEIRIQYAAKQARIANAWKKWIGENRGLDRLDAINVKKDLEKRFEAMVKKDAKLTEIYGSVLRDLKAHYESGKKYMMARSMLIEFFFVGPEIMRYARSFENIGENYSKLAEDGKLDAEIERLRAGVKRFYKNYQPWVDQKVLAALYPMYMNGMSADLRPDIHKDLKAKYGNDWEKYAADLFEKSNFTTFEKTNALLDKLKSKGGAKKILKDPAYLLSKSVFAAWREKAAPAYSSFDARLSELMQVYVRGLMTVFPEKKYWPDANSTLRLCFGKIEGSEPRDGVVYNPFTTLDGVLAKYVRGDREFDLPEKLIRLGKNRDYGQYADKDGNLPVCFTASNHTTGGNSGSPVLDGNGQLIGINFDRSWESTMSDIMYDPERCRNIVVDIRYVLFIIDKYAGASHLIKEMKIVK